MADIVSPEVRSRMMSGIRGKDTKPELLLRRLLFRAGFRFRLHRKDLAGKPDIVLPKWNAVIYVHGCFWHRHDGCHLAATPSTRPEFWQKKFESNVARDIRNRNELLASGWRVGIVWECGLRKESVEVASLVDDWLKESAVRFAEFPSSGHDQRP